MEKQIFTDIKTTRQINWMKSCGERKEKLTRNTAIIYRSSLMDGLKTSPINSFIASFIIDKLKYANHYISSRLDLVWTTNDVRKNKWCWRRARMKKNKLHAEKRSDKWVIGVDALLWSKLLFIALLKLQPSSQQPANWQQQSKIPCFPIWSCSDWL